MGIHGTGIAVDTGGPPKGFKERKTEVRSQLDLDSVNGSKLNTGEISAAEGQWILAAGQLGILDEFKTATETLGQVPFIDVDSVVRMSKNVTVLPSLV